jgi:putative membrane-bound dehydrogenase-like protein
MQRPLSPQVSQTYYATPEGFSLQLYAAEPDIAAKPLAMSWDARGRLWVCESVDYPNELHEDGRGNDRIRICEDTDGDGKADKFTVFAEGLSIPTSIAFYRGGAIVQNATETIYLKDINGDDRADERTTLISGWNMRDTHGGVSNFQYGLDNWIWAMQGYNPSSPRYVDSEGNEREVPTFRQGFFRFRLDQSDPPRVVDVEFLRSTSNNTWGLGISEEGLVFGSTANGNPSVFMSIPNRYYERVQGWSANTLRMISDTARFSPVTDKVRQVDNFGAYTAGAGHAVYTARTYPEQWWNRTAFVCGPTGHLVGVFVLEGDGAGYRSTSPMNLVASRDEWSAPIMAEVGPDGNVWIIDWYNYIVQHNPTPYGFETGKGAAYESELRDKKHARIYRLKYDGAVDPSTAALSSLDTATPAELVATLRHPTKLWRLHAQRLLVERGQLDVAPELIAMMKDNSVDAVGLNVGAIHSIGALRGLGAFDENSMPAALDALYAAPGHPSAGVRRNAILALPASEASRDKLLATSLLRDSDAQVQLAAILALSDLPPSRAGAEAVATLLMDEVAGDPWISDAISSAAAMHGVDFVQALAQRLPRGSSDDRQLSREVAKVADIVGEHIARSGLDAGQLASLLDALASADRRLVPTVLASLSRFWPEDRVVQLPPAAERAMENLLAGAPMDTKSDLLRLAQVWNVGNTDELQRQHSASLLAIVENADLADGERIEAAEALVRIDLEGGAAGRDILRMISPQTSLPLLTGLLRAVSESRYEGFADELLDLHGNLLPQGRQAVVEVLLEQPDSTNALLDAIAAGKFDVAGLSIEQMAALRAHPIQAIRMRADELMVQRGGGPDPDRQEALAALLSVAEAAGNAERGKELFAKHCAVCHMHGGVGETIAPDLTGMFVHPKKHILENIIDPSRDVETNFRSYSIISNGRVYVGMYAGESRTTVTMVDSTGKRHVIQRGEIEEVYSSTKSLMPDGFEKVLSQSDLADVLEFLATRQRYVPLRLAGVATTSSADSPFGRGFGRRGNDRTERGERDSRSGNSESRRGDRRERRERRDGRDGGLLALADWKPTTVGGVPFSLVDPQQGAVKNILLLGGPSSRFARDLPASVRLPCGLPAKKLHLLSGVSLGGFPFHPDKSTSLVVRFHYEDGQTEDHELKNGVHFANYREREDVPESEFAFRMDDQQMRYLALEPKRADALIADIEFIKADDPTLPIVLAVTAELP